ncbi:hypothetical protein O7626_39880 [Micromonospora sp. WMMD1102]|uniref:hypothetical protein n=1 Tax=Micromonospora sp. WMMD1102 TaxID=3016105 RepID=UPI0024157216|nr:hypothetical protein [Micromonospora sp. WMMD1102]MDG4791976.1 hypothetical protein [Micromonospora sp. WMMD1102]
MTNPLITEPDANEVHGPHGSKFRRQADGLWYRLNRAYWPTGRPKTWAELVAEDGPLTLPPGPPPEGSELRPKVLAAMLAIADGLIVRRGRSAINIQTGERCTDAVNRAVGGGAAYLGVPDADGVRRYALNPGAQDFVTRYRARFRDTP